MWNALSRFTEFFFHGRSQNRENVRSNVKQTKRRILGIYRVQGRGTTTANALQWHGNVQFSCFIFIVVLSLSRPLNLFPPPLRGLYNWIEFVERFGTRKTAQFLFSLEQSAHNQHQQSRFGVLFWFSYSPQLRSSQLCRLPLDFAGLSANSSTISMLMCVYNIGKHINRRNLILLRHNGTINSNTTNRFILYTPSAHATHFS